jgi:hypothetical protein
MGRAIIAALFGTDLQSSHHRCLFFVPSVGKEMVSARTTPVKATRSPGLRLFRWLSVARSLCAEAMSLTSASGWNMLVCSFTVTVHSRFLPVLSALAAQGQGTYQTSLPLVPVLEAPQGSIVHRSFPLGHFFLPELLRTVCGTTRAENTRAVQEEKAKVHSARENALPR